MSNLSPRVRIGAPAGLIAGRPHSRRTTFPLRPALLLLAAFALFFAPFANAEVVDEDSMDFGFLEEIPNGTGYLHGGPGATPAGFGSAHFNVDDNGREIFGTILFNGTRLDQLTSLSYATYRSFPQSGVLALSLQINTDYDLTDGDTTWQGRLVFEPTYTGIPVLSQTWQTWDTLAGEWWSSGAPGNTVCPQNDPCTWAEVLAAFPNAGVHVDLGALLIKAGGPWTGGFYGATDDLRVGVDGNETAYDFETNARIFSDTFETGDTTEWTFTVNP